MRYKRKTTRFLNNLGSNKSKYTAYQTEITAYYMKHPDAGVDKMKKDLGIKLPQNLT